MNLSEIGQVILVSRKSMGLTQMVLAEKAHVSRYTIIKLETGASSDIQFKTLIAILAQLRLTLSVKEVPVSGIAVLGED